MTSLWFFLSNPVYSAGNRGAQHEGSHFGFGYGQRAWGRDHRGGRVVESLTHWSGRGFTGENTTLFYWEKRVFCSWKKPHIFSFIIASCWKKLILCWKKWGISWVCWSVISFMRIRDLQFVSNKCGGGGCLHDHFWICSPVNFVIIEQWW